MTYIQPGMECDYAIKVLCGEMSIDDVPIMFKEKAKYYVEHPEDVINEARSKKWDEIKAIRNSKETSGCPFKGSVIDSDERSVTKINTAVQTAMVVGESFTIDWTMQDNSVMTLTYSDILSIPVALAAYSNYLHEHARVIREKIYSTNEVPAVMAIDWGVDDYEANI